MIRVRNSVVKPCECDQNRRPDHGWVFAYLLEIPWHLAEPREAVPDLPNDDFPDLRFGRSVPIFRCDFPPEHPLRQWAEVAGEKDQRVVGCARSDEG